MKHIIRLALLLVVGILVYNYFLGTPEEKATSKRIFNDIKNLAVSAWELLESEKQKLNEGKYDEALSGFDKVLDNIKNKAESNHDQATVYEVEELKQDQENLQKRIQLHQDELNAPEDSKEKEEVSAEWKRILDRTQELAKKSENQ